MTPGLSELEAVARLALSFVLGAALGLEREAHDRPAGLRTFILVSVGSTLFMIVSKGLSGIFGAAYADPGRIAAQVVTGIGFLGAGTIIHEGAFIRGLTTAAGLWVVSAIGLAVGAGFYLVAAATTILALVSLTLLAQVERSHLVGTKGYGVVSLVSADRPGLLGRVGSALGERGVDIKDIKMVSREGGLVEIELRVKVPNREGLQDMMQALSSMEGVRKAEFAG